MKTVASYLFASKGLPPLFRAAAFLENKVFAQRGHQDTHVVSVLTVPADVIYANTGDNII